MAKACIFCGKSPTTNAHVFRRGWVEEIFPGNDRFEHRHVRREIGGVTGFDMTWSKDEADIKVSAACRDCNGGWMDRLDRAAEDLFATKAAVWGASLRLDRGDQKELAARWCLLVAILFDQIQARPVISSTVHRALFDGRAPDHAFVWLLKTDPPQWEVSGWGEPSELRDFATSDTHAYLGSFGIKHLVAQVYIPADFMPEVSIDSSQNGGLLRQLWPDLYVPFIWPPPQTLAWDGRDGLNKRFNPSG